MTEIFVETNQNISTIVLNRPEKMNAFYGQMRENLLQIINELTSDINIRVVIITGSGRAFCAGGDVSSMHEIQQVHDNECFKTWLEIGGKIVKSIQASPKVFIAAVNGVAAGAGCNLALACDLRYCSHEATFGQSFVKLGLHTDWGGSYFLPKLVGRARAAEMMFTGNLVDAQTANEIGLVNQVFPLASLKEEVIKIAEQIASYPIQTTEEIKRSLRLCDGADLDTSLLRERDVQLKLWASQDSFTRVSKFLSQKKK